MQPSAQDYQIGPMRVLTQSALRYLHVSAPPAPLQDLDLHLDPLLERIDAAKAALPSTEQGPGMLRYYPVGNGLLQMEVGLAVSPAIQAAGDATVVELPAQRCAAVLLWGSLAHIEEAYDALRQAAAAAGLEHTGGWREWTYWFEASDSPNNLMAICMEVR